jgi:4a-hydroxytetrahydrobiopterin dehydratase
MPRLSDEQLADALSSLPGWSVEAGAIRKTFTFDNFVAAVAFVNRLAEQAEAAGHHPDIDIRYNRVQLALTTHDDGGITDKDTALAAQIDDVA